MYATEQSFQRDRVPRDRSIYHGVQIEWTWFVPHLFNRHWPFPRYTR
jgi:hypothetical protein